MLLLHNQEDPTVMTSPPLVMRMYQLDDFDLENHPKALITSKPSMHGTVSFQI